MKRTIRTVLAILSFLVTIAVAVSVVYRLGESRASGERYASSEYSIFRNAVMSAQTPQDFSDNFLRERLKSLFGASQQLLAAQVIDQNGQIIWQIPSSSSYFLPQKSTGSQSGFAAPTGSSVVFSTPLNGGMKLIALYATITRADIRVDLLSPFIVLAGWTILVVIVSLLLGKESGKAPKPETVDDFLEMPSTDDSEIDSEMEESNETEEIDKIAKENMQSEDEPPDLNIEEEFEEELELDEEPSENRHIDLAARIEEVEFREELSTLNRNNGIVADKEMKITAPLEEVPPLVEPVPSEEFSSSKEATPQKEVILTKEAVPDEESPQEVVVHQEDASPEVLSTPQEVIPSFDFPLALVDAPLKARLTSELNRTELADIALMLIHCDLNSANDPAGPALSVTIKDYFGVKDLVFELGPCDFAVVLPGMDISGCLKMTEDLEDVLTATLGLYRDIEGEAPIFIGISSKSSRNVDAFRVYKEAGRALEIAYNGTGSKILAFRPRQG
jgi:GGDEF domain-containing protein